MQIAVIIHQVWSYDFPTRYEQSYKMVKIKGQGYVGKDVVTTKCEKLNLFYSNVIKFRGLISSRFPSATLYSVRYQLRAAESLTARNLYNLAEKIN